MSIMQNQESTQNFKEIFSKVGQLTRLLRDSIANLGLDRAIMDVAEAIPDTRARLNYVVGKTSEAAECALTCVENARPLQEQLSSRANNLSQRWDDWFAHPADLAQAKTLVCDTRGFLSETPELAGKTNKHLMEIMMAQDFQDLTGQVIQHLMVLIENIERELVQVLLENMPEMLPENADKKPESLKNGPQVNQNISGIMASQDQVDDLLETLGF